MRCVKTALINYLLMSFLASCIFLCLPFMAHANIVGGTFSGQETAYTGTGSNDTFFAVDTVAADAIVANAVSIPEPSTMVMMFMGLLGSAIPFIRRNYNRVRRAFDVIISVVALIITAPVMLVCAILIKLESPGPVLFEQVRVGVNRRSRRRSAPGAIEEKRSADYLGKPFSIYKLRTMRADAEAKTGPVWAQKNDCRITKVGKFLRKTRLDEIPQFVNVLKGDMSIIGPRPERPVFVKELNKKIPYYHRRFMVKPGITGLAQTRFRYASSIEDTRKKLKYDLLYAKKMCMFVDTGIMLDTVRTVLFARGR